jgi:glycosyltransferase involved in cell wall biosynthesis
MIEGGQRLRGVIKSTTPAEPLLSVITVVYNGAIHIERAIESVLSQDYENIEYIIVDGGSSDGTVEKIKLHDDKIDYWVSRPDNGIYDAMNNGIALSKGELIGYLNSDDYYEPGSIKQVITAYLDAGCRGIYFGNSYVVQEDLNLRYISIGKSSLWHGLGFKHQAMFVHRHIHDQIGMYSTAYKIASDYDLVMNAVLKGVKLVHIDKILVNYSNMGVSGMNQFATLCEIGKIVRHYHGSLSIPYFVFVIIFARSWVFQSAGRIVYYFFGERALKAVRAQYTKLKFRNRKCHDLN